MMILLSYVSKAGFYLNETSLSYNLGRYHAIIFILLNSQQEVLANFVAVARIVKPVQIEPQKHFNFERVNKPCWHVHR